MSINLLKRVGLLFCLIALISAIWRTAFAQEEASEINIKVGQSKVFDFPQPVKRVAITNPDVADAFVTSPYQVLINGKDAGATSLVIWDEQESYQLFKLIIQNESARHQVMIQVRFAEVSKTLLKELGVDFIIKALNLGDQDVNAGSFFGKVSNPNDPLILGNTVDFFLALPQENLTAIIKALEENNCLTILAKPNVSAISGAEASFLAGGEFPIPIVSGAGGMQTVTIQFKEYGIGLKFLPTVLDEDIVNMQITTIVSNLDFENGISLSGYRIPALNTRKTETTVELKIGQYLAIGGLFHSEDAKTISKLPLLGDLPILGKLFSSTRFQNKESELIILVSPQSIKGITEDELPEISKIQP